MTEIIHSLYHMVDEWVDRNFFSDPRRKELFDRQSALQDEIIRRLGDDGMNMMESLTNLNLELEDLHDETLFRAAMQLGTKIAGYGRSRTAALSTSQLNATGRWSPVGTAQRRPSRRRDR